MKRLKDLFSKRDIQRAYDYICYSLVSSFNAVHLNENNEFSSNLHVQQWIDKKYFSTIKEKLYQQLTPEEFSIFQDHPKWREPLLIFHMKSAIYEHIIKKDPVSARIGFTEDYAINTIINEELNTPNYTELNKWIKSGEDNANEWLRRYNYVSTQHKDVFKSRGFLTYLKRNHEAKEIKFSEKVQDALIKLRENFQFKSLTIFPCGLSEKDIITSLQIKYEELQEISETTGIPPQALGMGKLNISFKLTDIYPVLSYEFSKVNAYFYTVDKLGSMHIHTNTSGMNAKTLIHEYGHFLSSLIFKSTADRNSKDFTSIKKWDKDEKWNVLAFPEAHALKLDWIAKLQNNSNWEELKALKETTPKDAGYRYLEHGMAQKLVDGLGELTESFLKSEPIIHDKIKATFSAYMTGLLYKLVEEGCIPDNSKVPLENRENAIHFFMEETANIFYHHPIQGDYLKALLRLSFLDHHAYYLANPEEIWARSFEKLLTTTEENPIDYKVFKDKPFNPKRAIEEMFIEDFHLNSIDRLHLLYFIKYTLDEVFPDNKFIPEETKAYKDFLANNPNEDPISLEQSEKIFRQSIEGIKDYQVNIKSQQKTKNLLTKQ